MGDSKFWVFMGFVEVDPEIALFLEDILDFDGNFFQILPGAKDKEVCLILFIITAKALGETSDLGVNFMILILNRLSYNS
ncbi:hypothetical protein LIER_17315 [Lithospermum erythrorhizon]|uniref:Uncharacterized protein n=1 Tax=Lithospermum erythrorhizon TaxID=34254 RepID=A0AAV3Q9Y3_LITER